MWLQEHRSFPCIVHYIVFNEGWGQYDTVRVVELAKSLDASRIFDGASGWVDAPVRPSLNQFLACSDRCISPCCVLMLRASLTFIFDLCPICMHLTRMKHWRMCCMGLR